MFIKVCFHYYIKYQKLLLLCQLSNVCFLNFFLSQESHNTLCLTALDIDYSLSVIFSNL